MADTPPVPPPAASPPVQVNASLVSGPDGKAWPAITITYGFTAFTITVPEGKARQLGPFFNELFTEVADAAHQANSGIVIAPADTPLPPLNGRSN